MLLLLLFIQICLIAADQSSCNPYFVRWPRVKLNFRSVANASVSLRACQSACSLDEHPHKPRENLECAALNHHPSPDGFSHHCDVFQPHQLQNVDGYVEADDRYSFYWKYCLNSSRKCGGDYSFTYLSDRFMSSVDVNIISHKNSLEECLSQCLEEKSFSCRSISFNRTDGGCHLSENNQLTKPKSIRLNNNPNFRIDYYENNCFNISETFKMSYECEEDGIRVKINSKFPYSGALYGLYDFFTCRIEPKDETDFSYFFPSPTKSKNCSDSIRFKGNEMVLEIVLSTDGVEPLYFITPDDLTFHAKCPIRYNKPNNANTIKLPDSGNAELDASAHALFTLISNNHKSELKKEQKDTFPLPITQAPTPLSTLKITRKHKDLFPLPITSTMKIPAAQTFKTIIEEKKKNIQTSTSSAPIIKDQTTKLITTKPSITTKTFKTIQSSTIKSTSHIIINQKKKVEDSTIRQSTSPVTIQTTQSTTTKPTSTVTTTKHFTTTTYIPSTQPIVIFSSTQKTEEKIRNVSNDATQKPTSNIKSHVEIEVGPPGTAVKPKNAVSLDIYHNGQSVEAVVVGTKISLSFAPHYAIPPEYMSVRDCQVEPIDPKYEWERDPLPIIKDGCQADLVGLVCPPIPSEFGIKITVESFRYQTTPQVQYSCLVRICPFAPCPINECEQVDGCLIDPRRGRRAVSLEEIRRALQDDPSLASQIGISPDMLIQNKPIASNLEEQLIALGGDHVVKRRLVVVNSEDQLRYYVRTGDIP